MKHLIKATFLIASLFAFLGAAAQWRIKVSNCNIHGCAANFPSAKTGYMLCSPNLFCTLDSGKTWGNIPLLPNNNHLFDVYFLNDTVGWVAGGNHPKGVIFKTRDGGKTWTKNKTVLKQILKVHFIDEQQGWAVGNENLYSVIYHTTDGGNDWVIQYEGTDYLRSIHFISPQVGWAAGDNGQLFYTNNGGQDWIQSLNGDIIHYRSILGISTETAWAGGGYQYGALYLTNDAGIKWKAINNNTLAHINCISILNKKEIWLAGDKGTIMYSPNGGRNWLPQNIKSKEDIKYIKFFASGYGVAVGEKGTLFMYP
jgi:photosystem II stability/assembly factor-like uncharacterized protein